MNPNILAFIGSKLQQFRNAVAPPIMSPLPPPPPPRPPVNQFQNTVGNFIGGLNPGIGQAIKQFNPQQFTKSLSNNVLSTSNPNSISNRMGSALTGIGKFTAQNPIAPIANFQKQQLFPNSPIRLLPNQNDLFKMNPPQQVQAWQPIMQSTMMAGLLGGPEARGFRQTGSFSSLADKKTRFEIPDNTARVNTAPLQKAATTGDIVPLGNVLKHPQLYQNYPEMANMPVSVAKLQPGTMAQFDPRLNAIVVDTSQLTNKNPQTTSLLLHEVQHAIQQKEGFASGTNWQSESQRIFNNPNELSKYSLNLGPEQIGKQAYKNNAGEIEARSVQDRRIFTPAQRKAIDPYGTQNIPLKDQIVRFGDNPSASSGIKVPPSVPGTGMSADEAAIKMGLPKGPLESQTDITQPNYTPIKAVNGKIQIVTPGEQLRGLLKNTAVPDESAIQQRGRLSQEEPLPWETPEFKKANPDFGKSTAEQIKENNAREQANPDFVNELEQTARQYNKGQGIPGKVSLVDYFRTPENVLNKIGLGDEARGIRSAWDHYEADKTAEINRIANWQKQVPDPQSAVNIFRYLDAQDGTQVSLSPKELQIANEIKPYLKEWAEKLGLPPEKQISNYITHIYESDPKGVTSPELMGILTDKPAGSVYDPFLQKRYGKGGYVENVWRALDAYVKRATRKYNMDPALKRMSQSAEGLDSASYNYVKSYAARINMRPTDVDTLLDNVIKGIPGVGGRFTNRPINRITQNIRQTIGRAALGLNPLSAMRNLTQGVNTYAKLGERYTASGYFNLVKNMVRKDGLKELFDNGVLNDNVVQDRRFNAVKSMAQKMDEGLFKMFDLAEKINRGAAYFGAKSKALNEGKTLPQAIEYAKGIVRDTQFTFGSVDTPLVLSSDIAKTIGQFQSYSLKQTEFLAGMLKHGNFVGLARYIGGSLVLVSTFGKLFGMKPTDMIPFFDQLTGTSRFQTPLTTIGTAVSTLPDLGSEDEQKKQKAQDNLLKAGSLLVPAGVQLKRTVQGLSAFGQGGSYNKNGNLQYKIPQTPGNFIKTAILGKNNLPEAQAYFDKTNQYFNAKNEAQSKLNTQEMGAMNSLTSLDKTDPGNQTLKDTIFIQYPKVFNAYSQIALAQANGNVGNVDPLYTSPDAKTYLKYQQLNDSAPGSAEEKQYLKNHPEVLQLIQDRQAFFQTHPITGQTQTVAPPIASPYVQMQLAAKNYTDPQTAQYLNDHLNYVNSQRAKMGLDPLDKYGNIMGSKNYVGAGGSGGGIMASSQLKYLKKKALRAAKRPPKKLKIAKGRRRKGKLVARRSPKIKLTFKPTKLPKVA